MTANEQYRQYKKDGGTLSFKDYMTREKTKRFVNFDGTGAIPVNKPLSDSISETLNKMHIEAGLKTSLENKYIFGIHKNVWIVTGVIAVGITAYVIYKNNKK